MDNSIVQSRSLSSINPSNQPLDPLSVTNSMSNPPEFVNHGLLLWNQTWQQWLANKKTQNRPQIRESTIRALQGVNVSCFAAVKDCKAACHNLQQMAICAIKQPFMVQEFVQKHSFTTCCFHDPDSVFCSRNASYESLLGTNKPFPLQIPLAEMVDFLVDVWEHEGLYD